MINSFDTDVALDVGINAAIIYKNIEYWCEHNRTNDQHFHDGYYWTFNSMKAYAEQFPYLSEKQIRASLRLLEEKGYIKVGNYNKASYDRTKWYADIRKGTFQSDKREDSICPTGRMDLPYRANGFALQGEPIPDINTNINTNEEDIYISDKPKKSSRFIPPSVEEVEAYCDERNNLVDAERFVDYYTARGWKIGKNPMKDWKAAVRTWERNNYSGSAGNVSIPPQNPFTALLKEEGYE